MSYPISSRVLPFALTLALSANLLPAWAEPAQDPVPADSALDTEAGADDPSADAEHNFYAVTTVTATGYESDTHTIPIPVSVIADPTEKAADNAADLLRYEPGVDVNGVGTNQARPVIRGQRGLRILFLEDGLRMNNARRQTDFGEIPGLVDLEAVDRVEVVRGPASVLYGSDAIGGVLNLITRVPGVGDAFRADLSLRYSTADEQQKAHAGVSGQNGVFSYALGYTWRDAEDYEAPGGDYGLIHLGDDTTVLDTGVKDDTLTGYFGWRPSDHHGLFGRLNRYRADQTGFGFVPNAALGVEEDFNIRILYPYQNFDKYTFGYQGSALGSPLADTVDAAIYYQKNRRELVNDIDINIGPIFPGAPDSSVNSDTLNFTELETLGLRTEVTKIQGTRQILTFGVEGFRDESFNTDSSVTVTTLRFPGPPFRIVSTSTDTVANAPNARNFTYGAFAQDEILFTDRFKAIAGLRYQSFETRAEATPGWDIAGLDFSDSNLVGAINLLFAIDERFSLVANWGTAFRAPSIVERLFNGPTPEGIGYQVLNPALESEESENIDLGVKFQNARAFFEVFYFENDIDNGIIQAFLTDAEIAALPAGVRQEIEDVGAADVVQQRNADRLRYKGYELAGAYRWDNGFSVGGNWSHLEGIRFDGPPIPTGNYADKLNAYLRYEPFGKPYRLEYRVRRNGSDTVPLSPGETPPVVGTELPSFTIHTLSGAYDFEAGGTRHTLGLILDNLTDELYAEFSNATFFRPQTKRNVILTYRLAL